MKKSIFLFIMGIAMSSMNAQSIFDGLRYATDGVYGTARYNAMSGAFGALGGDLSAMHLNPAGSAVFTSSYASASATLLDNTNEVFFSGTNSRSIDTDANISQAGGVWVFYNSNEEAKWRKFSIGINYELLGNYDDEVVSSGTNTTSIDQFFLNQAQGVPLSLLRLQSGESISSLYQFLGESEGTAAQNAFLGFQGYIIDPDEDTAANTNYFSNLGPGSFDQEHFKNTNGYHGKYTFNFAAQFKDDLYIGANLNTHSIDYRESTFLFESNENVGSTVNRIGFENNLWVLGSGFSAQIGAIAKINDQFRLGVTYDTPTWFTISEETSQYLETRRITTNDDLITEVINPDVVNIFADYKLRTPGSIKASAAVLFGQEGLISFDYGYKDYAQIEFRPKSDIFFSDQNAIIDNNLKASSSYRIGGEYRYNQWSFRGGYRYEESPFNDTSILSDLTGYSFGLGYAVDNVKIDLSYAQSTQDRSESLYSTGLTTVTNIDNTLRQFTLTIGFGVL
ncbi:MAG: transporter [Gilvibacter sp.]